MTTDWSDQVQECKEQFASERNEEVREEIIEHVRGYPLLEVGCGTEELESHAKGEYLSLDFTEEFKPGIVGDAQELPLVTDSVPTVVTKNVLQHVEDWQSALWECARVASHRVVHCERTHSHETEIETRHPVLKRRFNEDDFLDAMPCPASAHDSSDYRLTIFVGVVG